jgi:NADH:ubiquinone oxidoreductase subunit K
MTWNWTFSRAPLENIMMLAAVLFCLGVYTILTRKNAVSILMGVDMVLNAANLNFVGVAQYTDAAPTGNAFVVFVILLAAAEAAVALAIILGIYQNFGKVDVDKATLMKE